MAVSELTDQEFQSLFDRIDTSLNGLNDKIENARELKQVLFAEIRTKIETVYEFGSTLKPLIEKKRSSLIEALKGSLKSLFDGLRNDAQSLFSWKKIAPRSKSGSFRSILERAIKRYMNGKKFRFLENKRETKPVDFIGKICYPNCFKYTMHVTRFLDYHHRSRDVVMDQVLRFRNDLSQPSRNASHHYLFEQLNGQEQVKLSSPVQLFYDIFTIPTNFYWYGSQLLLVSFFYEDSIGRVRDKLRSKRQNIPKRLVFVGYFALFDSNFNLLLEDFDTESTPRRADLTIRSSVAFLESNGFMLVKMN